ncbi:MAG: GNAT family N-acetyltransferase [Gemmatimonadaceae bacterium]
MVESRGVADVDTFRMLVHEHADALAADLPRDAIRRIRADAAALPGPYAPPSGAIVLAWLVDRDESSPQPQTLAGGGAIHALDAETAEVKRMFVRPACRGAGVGAAILTALTDAARTRGHRRMRLGTVPELQAAIALYTQQGFVPIPPYRDHELSPDTIFFERAVD